MPYHSKHGTTDREHRDRGRARERDRGDERGGRGYHDRYRDRGWHRSRSYGSRRFGSYDRDRHDDPPSRYRRAHQEEIVRVPRDRERSSVDRERDRKYNHGSDDEPKPNRGSKRSRSPEDTKKTVTFKLESPPPPPPPPSDSDSLSLVTRYGLGSGTSYNNPTYSHYGSTAATTTAVLALPPLLPPLPPPPPPPPPPEEFMVLNSDEQQIIDKCIQNFKARGDYDKIRRECLLDIDTKPAFMNQMEKVKDITSRFLQTAQFHPNMNKAKMRENLKKSFELSKTYQSGVESLVNQMLGPQILSTIQPMAEAEIFRLLGVKRDKQEETVIKVEPGLGSGSSSGKNSIAFHNNGSEAEPGSSSCLPPFTEVILEDSDLGAGVSGSKQSASKPKWTPLPLLPVANDLDLQLHQDILEELRKEETDMPQLCQKVEAVLADLNLEGDVKTPADSSERVKNTEEIKIEVDTESVPEENKILEELLPEEENEMETDGDEEEAEEEEDDEDFESPAFEKIGDVSPVRVEPAVVVPMFDFIPTNPTANSANVQVCETADAALPSSSLNNLEETSSKGGSNVVEGSEQDLCRFLELPDEVLHNQKLLYLRRIREQADSKLLAKGKLKVISPRQA